RCCDEADIHQRLARTEGPGVPALLVLHKLRRPLVKVCRQVAFPEVGRFERVAIGIDQAVFAHRRSFSDESSDLSYHGPEADGWTARGRHCGSQKPSPASSNHTSTGSPMRSRPGGQSESPPTIRRRGSSTSSTKTTAYGARAAKAGST